jgi:hypothetical protein
MGDVNIAAWVGNTLAPTAIFGWIVGIFPGVVLLAAFLFYILQMYESVTFQTWLRSRRLRKMARLKIKMASLEAVELLAHPAGRSDLLPARKAAQLILEEAREQAKIVIDEAKHADSVAVDEKH